MWPTFFDIKKKEVLETEQMSEKPGGGEFRNRWLRPVTSVAQNVLKDLKDDAK